MKKIWHFLKHHIQQDFNPWHYSAVAIILIISLAINYSYEIEDVYLESFNGINKFVAYFIFYSIAYFTTVTSYAICYKRMDIFKRRSFWIKSIFVLAVLGLDGSVPFLSPLIDAIMHPDVQYWAFKVSINATSFFIVFLPILLFYFMFDKKHGHYYGLQMKHFDTKPYFAMLLIMLPLLIAASFHGSFLNQYPMYRITEAHVYLDVPEWVTVMIYEIAYGFDFITVEYIFRGFMVIGMMTILGRGSVLAMAVVYCYLHFGKPAGEAISSIAGGYILGVVAYETKSIWGGVIVHMGIAWLMELIAFIHKT